MKYIAIVALFATASAIKLDREPLLTWKEKTPAHHPMDYFVPSFGVDTDIEASLQHSAALDLAPEEKKTVWEQYHGSEF